MSGLLARKVAVVYGGGGAIGGAVARVFAREGAHVFLAGRTRSKLEAVARDIQSAGGLVQIEALDVFDERARNATLLGRLPKLAEVAEFAAFAASGRAGAMTGAIANLTCGSLTD